MNKIELQSHKYFQELHFMKIEQLYFIKMRKQVIKPKPKFVALSFNTTTTFWVSQIPDKVFILFGP